MKRSKIFSGCCNSLRWFLMGKNNYKLRKNHINCRDVVYQQGKNNGKNKRRLSAEGCSLLPSALRPRLLGQKFTKNTQFWAILALFQIVAASTIFGSLCSTPVSAASLTLTIPSSFSLDITPGANGVFSKSSEQTINVKTDNTTGYTLSIKAKNGENSNSLLNGSNKLSSISESTTEDLFKSDSKFNNTWGYLPSKFNSETNTNFLPGPTTEESLLETTEEANETGTDYNITIGAKVDNDISSGTYTNTFIFSALVNKVPDGIMQDWAADENNCKNLPIEQTINLLDKRDNNIYTVARLKDGKCWMTQNLRLGDSKLTKINPERKLTATDTDVKADYVLSETSIKIPEDWGKNEIAKYGAYYSYDAATAGTGPSGNFNWTASGSICPKGWRLPESDSLYYSEPRGDFCSLVKAYGGTCNQDTQTDVYDLLKEGTVPNFILLGDSGHWWSPIAIKGDLTTSEIAHSINREGTTFTNDRLISGFGQTAWVRCLIGTDKGYTITYELNGGEDGPEPNPQIGFTDENTVKLSDKTPSKDGYDFFGWCSKGQPDNNNSIAPTCDNYTHPVGDSFNLNNGFIVINLYAIWKIPLLPAVDKGNLGLMQSFDCNSSLPNVHEYGVVTDSRDNNTYRVAKLMDGKCWMAENLKIAGKTIYSSDSDITSDSYFIPSSNLSNFKGNEIFYPNREAVYVDSSYGGYYSWNVATAGTGASLTNVGENATSSICPKGWRLPTGGSNSEFGDLVNTYGGSKNSTASTNLQTVPIPGFTKGGYVYFSNSTNAISEKGYNSGYWSSTSGDYSREAYSMFLSSSSGLDSSYSSNRPNGFSVRCVAR